MSARQPPNARRARKRPAPVVYGGLEAIEDKDNDFICPICLDIIEEPYMTKCGHSFCHRCIQTSLEQSNRCPKCNFSVEKKTDIFPNFLLNELILKHKQKLNEQKRLKANHQLGGIDMTFCDQEPLDLPRVRYLLEALGKRKEQLEGESKHAQSQVMKDFLDQVRQKKQEQLDEIQRDMDLIQQDLCRIEQRLAEPMRSTTILDSPIMNGTLEPPLVRDSNSEGGFNGSRTAGKQWLLTTSASRRKKVHQHFEDLEQCYFSFRRKDVSSCGDDVDTLDEFTESLSKFTRFSSTRVLATLNYASDIYNTSSIVSSIEFDRDCDYFAIAGVTKKIKVYEYGTVIRNQIDMHYPVNEMLCQSKISSIVWSSYNKGMLASADYDGTVTLWDAFAASKTRTFQEHEKRCWSVDFNLMDPKLLASGSDDSKVKLWYTNMEHSVASLEAKANVCCVKFNPDSRYHLAFGSADHCVHYFDLRNTKQALNVFKGHRKAVSYTKFVGPSEIVSASTDSQLKLWNLKHLHSQRTFKGHINEKNFVGLATDGDYVACGSENNSLYVYYKGLSKQLLTFKFDTVRSVLEKDRKDEDANEFVSAVSWKPNSNVLLAANSQGIIKVLELV